MNDSRWLWETYKGLGIECKVLFCDFFLHGANGFERYSKFLLYCFGTFTCDGTWDDGVFELLEMLAESYRVQEWEYHVLKMCQYVVVGTESHFLFSFSLVVK